ncbi:hypothetical protein [Streptomyces laurentii]|uniref:hypothetical protein n=1 Tax=Streptomyces laurentii TaxID=39478 RepID=UPI0036CE0425
MVQELDFQWSQTSLASRTGVACSAVGLVTAKTVVMMVLPVLRSLRRRLICTAWRAPGENRLFTVATLIRRISVRPQPVPRLLP